MTLATDKTLRRVATYRSSIEAEVELLRAKLDVASKEAEAVAVAKTGRPLPDDWAMPMQMAIKKTLRQVTIYGTSMETQAALLKAQLETASSEAEAAQLAIQQAEEANKALSEELASETRKKEMHLEKARGFYAEAAAAKKEAAEATAALASVQAELEQLRAGDSR